MQRLSQLKPHLLNRVSAWVTLLTLMITGASCRGQNIDSQNEPLPSISRTSTYIETPIEDNLVETTDVRPRNTATLTKVSLTQTISTPSVTPTQAFVLCSPLLIHPLDELSEIIGSPYSPPPPNRKEERHHGVDFAYYHYGERDTMLGEPVQSVLPGVVVASLEDCNPYGNFVIIETPRAWLTWEIIKYLNISLGQSLYLLYAHLDKAPLVKIGDRVEACQQIGEVGMSGFTEIPHLHLETRLGPGGKRFEVMRFYDTRATQEEMDNYVLWRTSGLFQHFDPMILLSLPLTP